MCSTPLTVNTLVHPALHWDPSTSSRRLTTRVLTALYNWAGRSSSEAVKLKRRCVFRIASFFCSEKPQAAFSSGLLNLSLRTQLAQFHRALHGIDRRNLEIIQRRPYPEAGRRFFAAALTTHLYQHITLPRTAQAIGRLRVAAHNFNMLTVQRRFHLLGQQRLLELKCERQAHTMKHRHVNQLNPNIRQPASAKQLIVPAYRRLALAQHLRIAK